MKRNVALFFTLLIYCVAPAQIDSINQRVFLIGDAGELLGNKQPVVEWIKEHVNVDDEKNTFIYLGDNIYPLGLPMEGAPTYEESKKILDSQIDLVKGKKGKAFFVMGNHDWNNGKLGGWQQAMNQINYINNLEQPNIEAWPRDGCPGPVPVELSDKVVAVFVDSQWFLYVHEKPGPGSNCDAKTVEEFATELREIVAMHPNQLIILVTHHPMYTFGIHGGDYGWKEHLFPFTAANKNLWIPLPVIGSIYPITRGVFGNLQDVRHPLYRNMVDIIEKAMKEHANPVSVAGHDHSLQMIIKDSVPYIVSGSGINLSRVKENRKGDLLFSTVSDNGFAMLEIRKSGSVEARFYTVSSSGMDQPVFVHKMDTIEVLPDKISKDSIPVLPDSIIVAANKKLKGNGLKNLFMGKNYRQEWTTPVKVPVLDLGKEQGGLVPKKQGGGKQTRSLRVEDKNGKEWNLRSIQKFPDAAIPPDLRSPFAVDIVEDGISASYPFASLSTGVMADALDIPHLRRKLVFIPDDPRLERFRNTFKNTLAVLEEKEPENIEKSYNTDELVLRLAKDNDDHVDQRLVLKARLLDNFYMDLDRHEGQWNWATRDTGKGKIYYPIPKDQDQAFYTNQGIIPWFAKKPNLVPELQGFRANTDNIKTFNRAARNFDRFFLNELDKETWNTQIDSFLLSMTDSVINTAMMRQPVEVRDYHAQEIANTLKARRNYFKKDMLKYYKFISKEVNIVGTNQKELFTIDKTEGGTTHVIINKIDKEGKISSKIYDRVFDPSVTKELRIYGLEDNDSFVIKGGTSPIKIRIIGGPGKDHFINEGSDGKLIVYDVTFEENKFSGNVTGLRQKLSADPRNNQYSRIFYKYNIFDPGLAFAYNVDDGLFLGGKFRYTSHGFRKEPFSTRHELAVGHALRTSSWFFRYEADLTRALGTNDLLLRAEVRAPINVTNFFGYGNSTVKYTDEVLQYRTRYNIVNVSALMRRQLQSWMRVLIGPTFQYFKLPQDENEGKFISNTSLNGLDPETLYLPKTYVGAEAMLDINSKNNQVIPTRGFLLDAGIRHLIGLNNQSHSVTRFKWDMSIFASFVPQSVYVFATRFGYYRNFGKFEFPQANYLGGTDNLRGYRRNRFAGRTMFFNNSELRFKLGNFNTYLFPGSFGVLLFHDVGRVWMDNQKSEDWHNGYGGGLWIAPIQRFVITASVAHSKEEKILPYVTFGFQF
ncbi:MAG TPA: BamA/TamA family outer membrane protein [Flavisolibacter sp.]|nr:BamA/TamA family outer membrane protein [Flavisolibacter sp.]